MNATCYGFENANIDLKIAGGVLPYRFDWSNDSNTEDLDSISYGNYNVTVTDSNNCILIDTFEITQPDSLVGTIVSPILDNGHNVSFNTSEDGSIEVEVMGGTLEYEYDWSSGDVLEDLFNVGAGDYIVVITDNQGCEMELAITLTEPMGFDVPTAFSPNGDNSNDNFLIRGIEAYPDNQFKVFNRWGNLVYEKDNYLNEWAGENLNGKQLPDGTYFVTLRVNDGEIDYKGYVDLRR